MNNGMEESAMRCASPDDIEVDDFSRFCEYAYRGDYTVPPWEDSLPELKPKSDGNQENGDDDCRGSPFSKKNGKKGLAYDEAVPDPPPKPQCDLQISSRTLFRTLFNSQNHLVNRSPITAILQAFEPKANVFSWQNFTPVFLA
ncbi:hypothetical protein PMIN05_012441, partial [Paraphaeosphaeria minitans]